MTGDAAGWWVVLHVGTQRTAEDIAGMARRRNEEQPVEVTVGRALNSDMWEIRFHGPDQATTEAAERRLWSHD